MSDQSESDEKPEAESRFEFGKSSRRTFLSRLGMASLIASAGSITPAFGERSGQGQISPSESKDAVPVSLRVNGKKYDLRIDPRTSLPVETIRITDPYNLYFTPDGTAAVVVAERLNRLDVYDRSSWRLLFSVPVPWPGADHLDFSADGHILMTSAEFSGAIVKVDLTRRMVVSYAYVGGLPVDVRLAPDGSVFFVANQGRHGVSVLDPERMEEIAFIPTGLGAHGLALNRDASRLYVSNRLAGTISVIDVASRQVAATWTVGGSPDMMQVSPDGRELWTSNRFGHTVSVVETTTGRVLGRIEVGESPHGLTYFPQPGLISLGHNGVYR